MPSPIVNALCTPADSSLHRLPCPSTAAFPPHPGRAFADLLPCLPCFPIQLLLLLLCCCSPLVPPALSSPSAHPLASLVKLIPLTCIVTPSSLPPSTTLVIPLPATRYPRLCASSTSTAPDTPPRDHFCSPADLIPSPPQVSKLHALGWHHSHSLYFANSFISVLRRCRCLWPQADPRGGTPSSQ